MNWHPYPSDTMGPCPICGRSKVDAVHSSQRAPDERQAELLDADRHLRDCDAPYAGEPCTCVSRAEAMTDERQVGLRERAKSTLREMHERVHDLPWGECEVCGTIRIALAAQVPAQEERHRASLTLSPKFGPGLWLDGRLVARLGASVEDSRVTPEEPEPRWRRDAMVFVDAVNSAHGQRPPLDIARLSRLWDVNEADIRATLGVPAQEERLDEARLAKAIDATTPQPPDVHHMAVDWRTTAEKAAAIAAEYRALGDESKEEGS